MTKRRMTSKDFQKEAMISRIKGNEMDYIEKMILGEVLADMDAAPTEEDEEKDDEDE